LFKIKIFSYFPIKYIKSISQEKNFGKKIFFGKLTLKSWKTEIKWCGITHFWGIFDGIFGIKIEFLEEN